MLDREQMVRRSQVRARKSRHQLSAWKRVGSLERSLLDKLEERDESQVCAMLAASRRSGACVLMLSLVKVGRVTSCGCWASIVELLSVLCLKKNILIESSRSMCRFYMSSGSQLREVIHRVEVLHAV